jgi:hypothetical protein
VLFWGWVIGRRISFPDYASHHCFVPDVFTQRTLLQSPR